MLIERRTAREIKQPTHFQNIETIFSAVPQVFFFIIKMSYMDICIYFKLHSDTNLMSYVYELYIVFYTDFIKI